MLKHFRMFADYNRWANGKLYAAARELTDAEYRQDMGAFFGSLHQTLNHLLIADRVWMHRFSGEGQPPKVLNAILFDELPELEAARQAEDLGIIAWCDGLDEERLAGMLTYVPVSKPVVVSQSLAPALAHFFNHQTHHRGQCHMTLTALGKPSLALDLIYFLREDGTRWA
ncbi:DinB family protein [Rhizobium sp. RAF56]|uniref:DinB family protein n=1 Tax=Rhizobium sp. RAF56 TaxID=3233062 RepID=UPI003F9E3631